ncbi:glycosyltransferase [Alteromonas oceanisediminis]|uniref:glycosyltransferase n=1 Tax=Alteromonas oceanisediminis TaxID=2836180 RepID=UPI001BD93D17|nr:glycosyltransferase [Alteromonas oceanisediminis]MBT0584933.1 glycosyltransferase [Alteromonas oceanisediminis]
MTSSVRRAANNDRNSHVNLSEHAFVLWGSTGAAFYLYNICKSIDIDVVVCDRAPECRFSYWKDVTILDSNTLGHLDPVTTSIVICADERAHGHSISADATKLGFTSILGIEEFKEILRLGLWQESTIASFNFLAALDSTAKDKHNAILLVPRFATGGSEIQSIAIARVLSRNGYSITMVSLTCHSNNDAQFMEKLALEGLDYHCLPPLSSPRRIDTSRPLENSDCFLGLHLSVSGFHYYNALVEYLLSHSVSKVFSLLDDANMIAGLAAARIPSVCAILSLRSSAPQGLLSYNPSARFVFPLSTVSAAYQYFSSLDNVKLVANSQSGRESYLRWLNLSEEKVGLLNNIINNEDARSNIELRAKFSCQDNTQIIIGVMRLEREKAPEDFVSVIARLRKRRKDFIAFLIGDGSMRQEISSLISELNLTDFVILLGAQLHVQCLMRQADILLHTAKVEGVPNVLLEAQINRCQIVCTNAGSSVDALADCYHDFMFHAGQLEKMAGALDALMASPDTQKKIRQTEGQNFVSNHYGAEQLMSFINW